MKDLSAYAVHYAGEKFCVNEYRGSRPCIVYYTVKHFEQDGKIATYVRDLNLDKQIKVVTTGDTIFDYQTLKSDVSRQER